MFCAQCGCKVGPNHKFCGQCGSRLNPGGEDPGQTRPGMARGREQLLQALERELSGIPGLAAARSQKTDLEIKSVLADARWGVGKKKVEYLACLLAREDDRTVVFWEMFKETGSGMGIFGGFKVETYKTEGRTASGGVREAGFGPGGKIIDYHWDYGRTRGVVEEVVRTHGWKFTTVLIKGKAMYKL